MATETRDLTIADARLFRGCRRADHHGRALYGQTVSSSVMVVEFLKFVGADIVFGIPGGASLPLTDALTHAHTDGALRYVLTGHEQGAAFEAEGYAAASGYAGFCAATSGPGATNLITGLADAYRDSRPVMALTGNTATVAETEAFQALDIAGITHGKATKASFRPERPDDVQDMLVHAYHTACSGRPGSVLVDMPKDVQVLTTQMRPWEEIIARYDWAAPCAGEAILQQAARMLAQAQRPLIYAGHGVSLSGATEQARQLSSRFSIPIATTVHGLGVAPEDERLNVGMLGMHGPIAANVAPYLADVVIALGARFDDRVVGARPDQFAPHARVVHIDIDHYQLNRVREVDLAIHGDVKDALVRLLEMMASQPQADRDPWLDQLAKVHKAMPLQSYDDTTSETLSHEFVYTQLANALTENQGDVVATFDVGTHQMKGAQWFPVSGPRSFITSGGMGSMGCAVPMAVGAWFARPEATVLAMVGDGGFVMSSHELDTIGSYGIPVKIVLFDDSALGMVTNWHGLFFEGRNLTSDRRRGRTVTPIDVPAMIAQLQQDLTHVSTADELASVTCATTSTLAQAEWPLFAATAAAYGIPAERVHTKEQFQRAIQRLLGAPGPYLLQVMLPSPSQVYPLMEPGTTPQDMVWRESAPGSGIRVYAHEHFDYEERCLRSAP